MPGERLSWDSVARIPRHKPALHGRSITGSQHAARIGLGDPVSLNLADASFIKEMLGLDRRR